MGLIFANLVDFDMLYGHRKDVEGFARSLEEFDALLGPLLARLAQTGSAADYRGPRLRSRSALAHHGSLARVRADSGVQPGRAARQESWACARRWPTWGRPWRRILAERFRTATSFLGELLSREVKSAYLD